MADHPVAQAVGFGFAVGYRRVTCERFRPPLTIMRLLDDRGCSSYTAVSVALAQGAGSILRCESGRAGAPRTHPGRPADGHSSTEFGTRCTPGRNRTLGSSRAHTPRIFASARPHCLHCALRAAPGAIAARRADRSRCAATRALSTPYRRPFTVLARAAHGASPGADRHRHGANASRHHG